MQPVPVGITKLPARFVAWWTHELAAMLPEVASGGMPAGRWIVLSVERDGIEAFEQRGNRLSQVTGRSGQGAGQYGDGEIAEVVARFARSHRFCIRVGLDLCFARTVEVPAAALHDADRIMALRLAHGMPFKPEDVLAAHYAQSGTPRGGPHIIRQLILKRSLIDRAMGVLAAHAVAPERIDCWDETKQQPLPLDFLTRTAPPSGRSLPLRVLAGLALLLGIAATALAIVRHETALATLTEQVNEARSRAGIARRNQQQAEQAWGAYKALSALERTQVPRLAVLGELTRLLPDTDYLVDIRIDGDVIDISGYSPAAAGLVPLLERSARFADARLTAPVTFDSRIGKERFSLRARIRPIGPAGREPVGGAAAGLPRRGAG